MSYEHLNSRPVESGSLGSIDGSKIVIKVRVVELKSAPSGASLTHATLVYFHADEIYVGSITQPRRVGSV